MASRDRYRLQPPGPHGPVVAPLSRAAVGDRLNATVLDRERGRICDRAAARLVAAEARHRATLEGLAAEGARQCEGLQTQTRELEAAVGLEKARSKAGVADATAAAQEHFQAEQEHLELRQQAATRQAAARQEVLRVQDETQAVVSEIACKSHQEIACSAASAHMTIENLRQQRQDHGTAVQNRLLARELEQRRCEDALRAQGQRDQLRMEAFRHTSAMTVQQLGDVAQGSKSFGQQQAAAARKRAAEEVSRVAVEAHEVTSSTDVAVREQISDSAKELEGARLRLAEVRAAMDQEAEEYAQRTRQLTVDRQAAAGAFEDALLACEDSCAASFAAVRAAVQAAEDRCSARRQQREGDRGDADRRLQEVEQESLDRAKSILAQWSEGNAATEAEVRALEAQTSRALQELHVCLADQKAATAAAAADVQTRGVEAASALRDRAVREADATQGPLEAARSDDDRAAAEATRATAELKAQVQVLMEEADAAVAAAADRAAQEDMERLHDCEARIGQAKAATAEARGQEARLRALAADAEAKVRKACYELRLMNLHDFARDIAKGRFDLAPPKEPALCC